VTSDVGLEGKTGNHLLSIVENLGGF